MSGISIALIGFNREVTHQAFRDLYFYNICSAGSLAMGVMRLEDGTVITEVNDFEIARSRRFDQIIIADDRRYNCLEKKEKEIAIIISGMMPGIPEEFRVMLFDMDYLGGEAEPIWIDMLNWKTQKNGGANSERLHRGHGTEDPEKV